MILFVDTFPVNAPILPKGNHKLPTYIWLEIAEQPQTKSLRQLAKEYSVSHEAVRRIIKEEH